MAKKIVVQIIADSDFTTLKTWKSHFQKCVCAVSYTHLDVYKRQIPSWAIEYSMAVDGTAETSGIYIKPNTLDYFQTAREGILTKNYFFIADNVYTFKKFSPPSSTIIFINRKLPPPRSTSFFIYRYFIYISTVDYYELLLRILYLSKLSNSLLLKHKS